MTLADGDYCAVEEKVAAALLADTAPGGLREEGHPAVATIRAGDSGLYKSLGQAAFPAILVRVRGKKEGATTPAYAVLKTFSVRLDVLERGLDREAAEDKVRQIAARLEEVLRAQTATDRQFLGLPDLVCGAEGVLVVGLAETAFPETEARTEHVTAQAIVLAEVQLPCVFRYE